MIRPSSTPCNAARACESLSTSSTRACPVRVAAGACNAAASSDAACRSICSPNRVPCPTVQAHGRLQQIGNALGNRQSEPQPLSACAIATPEFLERALLRRCRNARTCVEHVHSPAAIDPAHAQQHTAAFGVAHRIGQKVLKHASQQLPIGMRPRTGGAVAEAQAALGGQLDVLNRVASRASGGMDTLPHNGAVITLLAVTGLTHRQSYKDIFATTLIKTLAVFVIIGLFYATGMV